MSDKYSILSEKLYKALSKDISAEIEEHDIRYDFSPGFENKMRKLIKQQKKFYFPIVKTGIRKTAVIIIAVMLMMFGTVISVEAWRNAFFSFVTRPFATHTDIRTVTDHSAPRIIEHSYEPTFIPDGFTLSEKSDIKEMRNSRTFVNSKNNNESFDFEQWLKAEYTPSVNTEGCEIEPADVNGCEGFIIDMEEINCCLISWDNGDYVFQIVGNIDRDTIMKIARSVIFYK